MIKVRHTGIVVKNIEKAVNFYRDVLGLRLISYITESGSHLDNCLNLENVSIEIAKLQADDNIIVELLCYKNPLSKERSNRINDFGISHIAFTIENLDSFYNSNKEQINFSHPPEIFSSTVKMTFCTDPDGNHIELVEEKE